MEDYKKYVFGKKNRVYLYCIDNPIEKGMFGLIKSKIFEKQVGLYVKTDNNENNDLSLAGFYISSINNQPMIEISSELYDRKQNDEFIVTIFHELGHYYNDDYSKIKKNEDELRLLSIEQSTVLKQEKQADEFAVKYLGKRKVVSGLEEIKKLLQSIGDLETYQSQMSIREIELRINIIKSI